jgi:hypothetical protein
MGEPFEVRELYDLALFLRQCIECLEKIGSLNSLDDFASCVVSDTGKDNGIEADELDLTPPSAKVVDRAVPHHRQ